MRQNTHFNCICLTNNLKHFQALRPTRQTENEFQNWTNRDWMPWFFKMFIIWLFFLWNYFYLCHLNFRRFGMFLCSFYSTISNCKNQYLFTMFMLSMNMENWLSYQSSLLYSVHNLTKHLERKCTRHMYVFIFTMWYAVCR